MLGQKLRCAYLRWEGSHQPDPGQLSVLHMTFLLKLSETLKEVYCNVNNLSLVASVFLLHEGKSRGVHSGLCLRSTRPGLDTVVWPLGRLSEPGLGSAYSGDLIWAIALWTQGRERVP